MKNFLTNIHPDSNIDLPLIPNWRNNKNSRLKWNLPPSLIELNQSPTKIVWMIFDVIECWITHLPAVENCQKRQEKKSMFNVVFSNKKSLKGNSQRNLLNASKNVFILLISSTFNVIWKLKNIPELLFDAIFSSRCVMKSNMKNWGFFQNPY